MIIAESIREEVYKYNYAAHSYDLVTTLTESSIISAGGKRQCCADGTFEIGGVYAATFSMQAKILGMTTFQVRGAKLRVRSKYGTESAWHNMGTFWVTDATRVGEIFSVNAQDSVGWLDTSSYNDTSSSAVSGVGKVLADTKSGVGLGIDSYALNDGESGGDGLYRGWLETLTDCTNTFIQSQTGVKKMLHWHWQPPGYDSTKTYTRAQLQDLSRWYCNSRIYTEINGKWTPTVYRTPFYLYGAESSTETGTGASDSDTPRDFYRYLAELAFGFVYARPEDGDLVLGQFGHHSYGTVSIGMSEIEYDSCEVADYTLQALKTLARVELEDNNSTWSSFTMTNPDYSTAAFQRFIIESNPFLDGFAKKHVFQQGFDLKTIAHAMWIARYPSAAGDQYSVRPFSCTVHSTKRFQLGQKIKLSYRDFHETTAKSYDSIITAITWTFRGGTKLSCGGEDSRVMADCIRSSKGDKVRKEARNRCRALEKRVQKLGG